MNNQKSLNDAEPTAIMKRALRGWVKVLNYWEKHPENWLSWREIAEMGGSTIYMMKKACVLSDIKLLTTKRGSILLKKATVEKSIEYFGHIDNAILGTIQRVAKTSTGVKSLFDEGELPREVMETFVEGSMETAHLLGNVRKQMGQTFRAIRGRGLKFLKG